jgi:putative ABC transport system ATP-binding protein
MAQHTSSVIRLEGICKTFVSNDIETYALQDVDLEVRKGEYVAISGPSGCGKSTLLAVLGLLEVPSAGRYHLAGEDVSELSARQRALVRNREIGFVFQSFNLIGELTIFENVELPLVYQGMEEGKRLSKVAAALERVGLEHRRDHYPGQLSGGQQQRVAVARAVVTEPSVLLADEPTGNLDSKNGKQIMALLSELHKKGATIGMVTHDERFLSMADRIIQLYDGRVVPPASIAAPGAQAHPDSGSL